MIVPRVNVIGQSRAGSANFPSARYCVNTRSMAAQDTVLTKKRRGPAPTGKGVLVGVRLQPEMLTALDRWIVERAPGTSRPEAIRTILSTALPDSAQNG